MFITRLISGIVLVLLALLTIGIGGWVLFGTLLLISVIGASELYKAMKVQEDRMNGLCIVGYAGIFLYYLGLVIPQLDKGGSILEPNGGFATMMLILALVMIMFVYVFTYPKYQANQIMASFFAVVYVGVMLSYIYQTRMLEGGKFHVWLIFLCGNADRKTQDGTGTESEKVRGRCCGRRCRSCFAWLFVSTCHRRTIL